MPKIIVIDTKLISIRLKRNLLAYNELNVIEEKNSIDFYLNNNDDSENGFFIDKERRVVCKLSASYRWLQENISCVFYISNMFNAKSIPKPIAFKSIQKRYYEQFQVNNP